MPIASLGGAEGGITRAEAGFEGCEGKGKYAVNPKGRGFQEKVGFVCSFCEGK